MTDFARLGATLIAVGKLLERDGDTIDKVLSGWETGPQTPEAPPDGVDDDEPTVPDPERSDERKNQARAALMRREFTDAVGRLSDQASTVLRVAAVALPAHPAALRNVRTGDFDPVTVADAGAAGWCTSCWRNDQQMVLIDVNKKTGLPYYRDLCKWCGAFKGTHKIEPPLELLRLRHAGRRITVADVDAAVARAVAERRQKKSKKNRRKVAA